MTSTERTPEGIRGEIAALDEMKRELLVQQRKATMALSAWSPERRLKPDARALEDLMAELDQVLAKTDRWRVSLERELSHYLD